MKKISDWFKLVLAFGIVGAVFSVLSLVITSRVENSGIKAMAYFILVMGIVLMIVVMISCVAMAYFTTKRGFCYIRECTHQKMSGGYDEGPSDDELMQLCSGSTSVDTAAVDRTEFSEPKEKKAPVEEPEDKCDKKKKKQKRSAEEAA